MRSPMRIAACAAGTLTVANRQAAMALEVQDAKSMRLDGIAVVFAAVESDAARELEPLYARHVPTISTARPFRMEPDVPLVIPGVNLDHMAIVQRAATAARMEGFHRDAAELHCDGTGGDTQGAG